MRERGKKHDHSMVFMKRVSAEVTKKKDKLEHLHKIDGGRMTEGRNAGIWVSGYSLRLGGCWKGGNTTMFLLSDVKTRASVTPRTF